MILRAANGGRQSSPEFLLQELHDPPHPLQGKTLAAQCADQGDFGNVVKRVQAPAPFPLRSHHAAFVPPLELAGRDAGEPNHLRRCQASVHVLQEMFKTFHSTNVWNIVKPELWLSMEK